MQTMVVPNRHTLPDTRSSITHKFAIAGHEGYLTIGLFENGQPGEVFIKMSKEGSTLSGLIQGFCRAFSLALQHGLSPADAVERFRGMRFEPMGPTSNPEIPEASSILDYVARYIDNMSDITKPLRSLLKDDILWAWNHEHDLAMEKIKKILVSKPVLKNF